MRMINLRIFYFFALTFPFSIYQGLRFKFRFSRVQRVEKIKCY